MIAEIVLLLPSVLAMRAIQFVRLSPGKPAQTMPLQLVDSFIGPLSVLAWASLIFTVLTYIGCVVYWISSGYLKSAREPDKLDG